MKITAIIPSRYDSTRFAGKPLAKIGGKPMIERVYEAVQHAEQVTDVIVATDDDRIYQAVQNFRGKAVMTSGENRSGTDRVAEAARQLNLSSDDIIINVQGDQPLLDPRSIDELVAPFFSGSNPNMTTLAYKIVNRNEITNPKDVKVTFDHQGYALYFSRSPIPFHRGAATRLSPDFRRQLSRREGGLGGYRKHQGIYAYARHALLELTRLEPSALELDEGLEQLRALQAGFTIRVLDSDFRSLSVDRPEDLERAAQRLARQSDDGTFE